MSWAAHSLALTPLTAQPSLWSFCSSLWVDNCSQPFALRWWPVISNSEAGENATFRLRFKPYSPWWYCQQQNWGLTPVCHFEFLLYTLEARERKQWSAGTLALMAQRAHHLLSQGHQAVERERHDWCQQQQWNPRFPFSHGKEPYSNPTNFQLLFLDINYLKQQKVKYYSILISISNWDRNQILCKECLPETGGRTESLTNLLPLKKIK